jgi:hercynine metabolism small protein
LFCKATLAEHTGGQTSFSFEPSTMGREEQRALVRRVRESLIEELENTYRRAFDAIGTEDIGEGAVARLTQLLLRSRDGAITPLEEEIEAAVITRAPDGINQ